MSRNPKSVIWGQTEFMDGRAEMRVNAWWVAPRDTSDWVLENTEIPHIKSYFDLEVRLKPLYGNTGGEPPILLVSALRYPAGLKTSPGGLPEKKLRNLLESILEANTGLKVSPMHGGSTQSYIACPALKELIVRDRNLPK